MNIALLVITLLVIIGLPIAWLVSEFKTEKRVVRCTLGALAICSSFGVAWLTAQAIRVPYNGRYSRAANSLVEVIIQSIENNSADVLLPELKDLNKKISMSYMERGNFDELTRSMVDRIKEKTSANQVPEDTARGSIGVNP